MDFANASGEPWDWQYDEAWLERDSRLDISPSLWDEEDSMRLFDATTPIKNCTDMDYLASTGHYGENMKKGSEDCREHSQLKRRRMLQFNSQENDPCICNEQIPSAFVKSKEGDDSMMDEGGDINISDTLHEDLQWASRFSDRCTSGIEGLDQSSHNWLESCFNDSEMQINTDDVNYSGVSEDQIDISEFCTIPPEMETEAMQGSIPPAPRCIFTGNKSLIRTPTKLATPVAYPFALIKPCGVQGDVTLKDINQRILTPPSKSKHVKEDDPSSSYPTSAFSGKPVVVKTKIRTEGGKGSITIMRTRG